MSNISIVGEPGKEDILDIDDVLAKL